jgi:hypothetical protein
LVHVDGQTESRTDEETDRQKERQNNLIVAFCNFANAPKNYASLQLCLSFTLYRAVNTLRLGYKNQSVNVV